MDTSPSFDRLIAQGVAASREGRSQEAVALFEEALAMAPASGLPHFLAGSEHAAAGKMEAAEAAFASAVRLAPDLVLARYQLGLLQFTCGRPEVALLTWEPLSRQPPADSMGHFVRGFAALAQDDLALAMELFRSGLACPDANPAVAADVGKVLEAVEGLSHAAGPRTHSPDATHVLLGGYAKGIH